MDGDIWINRFPISELHEPVAVVGSPGLRSVGKLAVDGLIEQTKAQLMADLYSTHLPSIYQTSPSYVADASMPGMGGSVVEGGKVDFPKIQFFACAEPSLIFVRGVHPNFAGQYSVAEKVVDFLADNGVKRMIVIAGYGSKEKKICCAANSKEGLEEMKQKFGIEIGYKGPFMGFSGLVFGLAKHRTIRAVCLFAGAEPVEGDLEFPDPDAAKRAVDLLLNVLNLAKP